ncbi:ABC transporter permease [Microbacterium sp. CPCC 204701]|uniref:ABC transporter permease n=1 Tax=Microbacterium sp. CPCC 204701 TaxID=2493084 RepID=UPI000FDBD686|nr:ABC transporter permease [Microbacterium sp. CPCC 204701]
MTITLTQVSKRAAPVAGAVALTFAVVSAVILAMGANPLEAYRALWTGAFGSPFTIGQVITITSVLLLTGIAAAIPFSAGLWNVGGEGQLFAGAIGAVCAALTLGPGPFTLVSSLLAGAAAGAAWALVPGLLRAWLGASEMIVSLLMNFVAVFAAGLVIRHIFPDTSGQATRLIERESRLPVIWTAGGVNLGIVVAGVLAVICAIVMTRTRLGFGIRAVGLGETAAELAGFERRSTTLSTFAIAGISAGLAGALLVLGAGGQLSEGVSSNYGFVGIVVALVAGLRVAWIPLSALLFAALTVGSNGLQIGAGLPFSLGIVVIGVLVLTLLATRVITLRK